MKKEYLSKIIHVLVALGILLSIATTYYVMIVKRDFEVLTNPDGLPTLEE